MPKQTSLVSWSHSNCNNRNEKKNLNINLVKKRAKYKGSSLQQKPSSIKLGPNLLLNWAPPSRGTSTSNLYACWTDIWTQTPTLGLKVAQLLVSQMSSRLQTSNKLGWVTSLLGVNWTYEWAWPRKRTDLKPGPPLLGSNTDRRMVGHPRWNLNLNRLMTELIHCPS